MQPTLAGRLLAIAFCSIVSATFAEPRPIDYVNPLIGAAPLADKEYLGGSFVFEMGPEPNKQWGLGPRAR